MVYKEIARYKNEKGHLLLITEDRENNLYGELFLDGEYKKGKSADVVKTFLWNKGEASEFNVCESFGFKTTCPFCGTQDVSKEKHYYYCNHCERIFDLEDVCYEDLRHKISAYLMDTTEEEPLEFNCIVGRDEAFGLSELELPEVTSAFQDEEGIIWFNIYGCEEPMYIDDMSEDDLRNILKEIQNLKEC